jgi:hypothetical protein
MPPITPTDIPAIDLTVLTDAVGQDQRSPSFTLHEWSVSPLPHHTVIDTTGGLYCIRGRGTGPDGERMWSVVLKVVNHSTLPNSHKPRNWSYWRRELLAFQSGLLADLPGHLVAPRCYGTQEVTGGAWIWLEHVVETTPRYWAIEHYALAARHLGMFQGAYACGAPYPDAPWLGDGFFRSVYAPNDWWTLSIDPNQPGNIWENAVTRAWYSGERRERTLHLFAEREEFLGVLDCLPQVLCHNDAHRRNLLIRTRPDGLCETVALDWAFAGRGALGADLSTLVMASCFFFEIEPVRAHELATHVIDGYLTGLCDVGWDGDARIIQLGYLASVALGFAISMPGWTGHLLGPEHVGETTRQYGRSADEIAKGWLALWEYAHTCAQRARALMYELGLV